jgi:hypothetical protein
MNASFLCPLYLAILFAIDKILTIACWIIVVSRENQGVFLRVFGNLFHASPCGFAFCDVQVLQLDVIVITCRKSPAGVLSLVLTVSNVAPAIFSIAFKAITTPRLLVTLGCSNRNPDVSSDRNFRIA